MVFCIRLLDAEQCFPQWLSGKESACNAGDNRRHRFDP